MGEKGETWIEKVEAQLGIAEVQANELRRFLKTYRIEKILHPSETIRPSEGKPATIQEIVSNLPWKNLKAKIGNEYWDFEVLGAINEPFIHIALKVLIHGRSITLRNGNPYSDPDVEEISEPTTEFSDESHRIADALVKVFGGRKGFVYNKRVDCESLVVLLDKDHFEVAYNYLEADC